MNRSMPGLPVHHQLPEPAQAHVHRVGDALELVIIISQPGCEEFSKNLHAWMLDP